MPSFDSLNSFLQRNRIDAELWSKSETDWPLLQAIASDHEMARPTLGESAELFARLIQKFPKVHSVRWRVKDTDHVLEKIVRKRAAKAGKYLEISLENYYSVITDLVGVRALHLYKEDCFTIDAAVRRAWKMVETPVAYVRKGDPDSFIRQLEAMTIEIKNHPDGYRSLHYIVETTPVARPLRSEIQIRTIFEEAWSEIDHSIRYPNFSSNKLVGYFLSIFNRLAGSADEMGAFVNRMSTTITEFETSIELASSERQTLIQRLEETVSQLGTAVVKDRALTAHIQDLKKEIDTLKSEVSSVKAPLYVASPESLSPPALLHLSNWPSNYLPSAIGTLREADNAGMLLAQLDRTVLTNDQATTRRAQTGEVATWDDLKPTDDLALEVGYRLIPLAGDRQENNLLQRIVGVRKKFAQDVGFLPPKVHLRDNLSELKPSEYRVMLRGAVIGEGEVIAGMHLAINPGNAKQLFPGKTTVDPAFGLPAVWIEENNKESAQLAGFTVVDCATVVATHLAHLMQINASRLLGRTETQALIEYLNQRAPELIGGVVPELVSVAMLQRVLQLLLEEGVNIRDMRTIVECLAANATSDMDPVELTRHVRMQLAPAIVQQIYGSAKELNLIALDPKLERLVTQALMSSQRTTLDPGVAEALSRGAADTARRQEDLGTPACLLVPDTIRASLARLLKRAAPRLKVLGHSEIPEEYSIRIGPVIGLDT